MNHESGIRVYYNSACPVCNAGIEYQKGRMRDCAVTWRDVHADPSLIGEIGTDPDLESVRERLHLVDEAGRVHAGFDAFLEIWRRSPGEAWKARLFGRPIIRSAGALAYNVFAALLYRWNRALGHW